jgi:hypothetical protein
MGFLARTIFWLGLVYSAIPLDFGSLVSNRAPGLAESNPLAACASGPTDDCRRRVDDLRKVLDAVAALGLGERVAAANDPAAKDKPASRKLPQSRPNRSPPGWFL